MGKSLPNKVCVRGHSCISVFFNLGGFLFPCVVFEKNIKQGKGLHNDHKFPPVISSALRT